MSAGPPLLDGELVQNILRSVTVFVALIAAACVGFGLRRRLPASHRIRETFDFIHIIRGMLVTFVAVVLGLLLTSVKTSYEATSNEIASFVYDANQFDRCLSDLGSEAAPLRQDLQTFMAGTIAGIWTAEPPPEGASTAASEAPADAFARLGDTLDRINAGLLRMEAGDPARVATVASCGEDLRKLETARGILNGARHSELSTPFYGLLFGWLVILFVGFGILSPPNSTVVVAVLLCGVVLTSILFMLEELDQPYAGMFHVSSSGARLGLAQMRAR